MTRRRRAGAATLAAALLAAATVAVLALAGTRQPSAASRDAGSPGPGPDSTRMLGLRAADPGGGPPWGMRLLTTPQGLTCAQIGRVVGGRLGELGLDGAFGGDGRFHALPVGRLPGPAVSGADGLDYDCAAPRETFAGVIDGLDRNAADDPQGGRVSPAQRREISFGLLGVHALAVSFRSGDRTVTRPVLRPLGAYLVVQRADPRHLGASGAAPGGDYPDDLAPAGPTGALLAITYRYGARTCRDDGHDTVRRCHLHDGPTGPQRTPSQLGS